MRYKNTFSRYENTDHKIGLKKIIFFTIRMIKKTSRNETIYYI